VHDVLKKNKNKETSKGGTIDAITANELNLKKKKSKSK